jgi:K+-sensing histidine kinase KdpD
MSQIKSEIHEIRACTWQNELKSAHREELSHLFSSVSFDSAPLVNAILQEVEIVDSLQDTMNPDEHDALISLLESGKLTKIKRNLWSIKKMKSSSEQLDLKIM